MNNKVSIPAAIAAGADPRKLGLKSDMHNAYLEIEDNKHRNEADFF